MLIYCWKQVIFLNFPSFFLMIFLKFFSCEYLEISEFKFDQYKDRKKTIVLTSRVHPGESMVSYLIEYMIDYLIGNSVEAKILRENFVFFVIPMLNIDGVINGNYRANLAGFDLNRQYQNPTKQQHPTIYNLKNVILIILVVKKT